MGLINRRYNEINQEKHGRFCFMECYNDREVFHLLLSSIEDWVRQNGMSKIVGPLGFSDKDPQGFQIEGFEYPQFITSANNSAYMVPLIENEGYEKKVDLVNYLGELPKEFPLVYERVLDRMEKGGEYKIIEFQSKKRLRPYIIPILELMNETFAEIYGFVPLTDKEKSDFAARYLPILDPKFVKAVKKEGQLIGFAIGLPDLSTGIKACRGRLLPFGIFKVLRESKRSRKLIMMLGGVKKEFRGKGIDVLMGVKILQDAINSRVIERTGQEYFGNHNGDNNYPCFSGAQLTGVNGIFIGNFIPNKGYDHFPAVHNHESVSEKLPDTFRINNVSQSNYYDAHPVYCDVECKSVLLSGFVPVIGNPPVKGISEPAKEKSQHPE